MAFDSVLSRLGFRHTQVPGLLSERGLTLRIASGTIPCLQIRWQGLTIRHMIAVSALIRTQDGENRFVVWDPLKEGPVLRSWMSLASGYDEIGDVETIFLVN